MPAVRYEHVIVIEPALASYECYQENPDDIMKDTARATLKRRDTWKSRDDARAYLAARLPWAMWDPRARELYVVRTRPAHAVRVLSESMRSH